MKQRSYWCGNEHCREDLTSIIRYGSCRLGISNTWSDLSSPISELGLDTVTLDLAPVLSSLKNHHEVLVNDKLVDSLCKLTAQALDTLSQGGDRQASL